MIEQIKQEWGEWLLSAKELGKTGMKVGDSSKDPQRKKLSYVISKELLIQCLLVQNDTESLIKCMQDIIEYLEGFRDDPQKVKTLQRR